MMSIFREWVCKECGSGDIRWTVEYNPNTQEIDESIHHDPPELAWCMECEKRVEFVVIEPTYPVPTRVFNPQPKPEKGKKK